VTETSNAVFLSYASQDAPAARRICEALRAGGIEVWFDQSELRGGDAWDQAIRKQIKACALFIPVISANTHARVEGYFRLEWKLAVDRSYLIASDQPFLLPVVIDDTRENDERIPDRFRELHWTRLPSGETSAAFVKRVANLLSSGPSTATSELSSAHPGSAEKVRTSAPRARPGKIALLAAAALVVAGAVAFFAFEKPWVPKPALSSPTVASRSVPAGFAPPPHSIAVLPFLNMSGDKEQEYFSQGLTEEILNSLTEINELQVAARTSSFAFKGQDVNISTIAGKLNVGAVLEGSVRRSGHTVRVSAQLINAVTGFHLWSKTYDRDIGDVLKLQTEIATSVAGALKVTLLGDEAARIELGGTRNPAALDAYLRGAKAFNSHEASRYQAAIAAYTEAIRLDPNYALAFAGRSSALINYASYVAMGAAVQEVFDKAGADAREAVRIAPDLAEGHLQLASYLDFGAFDLTHAGEEFERATALAPGSAKVLGEGGRFAAYEGRFDAALAATHRAVELDPINPRSLFLLGQSLFLARRYGESVNAFGEVLGLDPNHDSARSIRGLAYYALADFQNARSSCEANPDFWSSEQCLAMVYDKLGRHSDAEAVLGKMKAAYGDAAGYQYATIYAQWGNTAKALEWLETATRLRDPGLVQLRSDPLMDPLRNEPRFQAVMRKLKFSPTPAASTAGASTSDDAGRDGPQHRLGAVSFRAADPIVGRHIAPLQKTGVA
jgi:TolB-like protein